MRTAHVAADPVSAAVRRALGGAGARIVAGDSVTVGGRTYRPVLVSDGRFPDAEVVVAAVDDDDGAGPVLRYGAAVAERCGVPLRAVHVWTESGTGREGRNLCRHDRIVDADRLLSALVHDHLPPDAAAATERQILHSADPAAALRTLSGAAAVLLIAPRSRPPDGGDVLGETAVALLGRTACPLAVLPWDGPEPLPPPCAW